MDDIHVSVINFTFLCKRDGTLALVPSTYAEAIKHLRFLNDFRIRRSDFGILYNSRANVQD